MDGNTIRAVIESFYADIWNRRDESRIRELLSPDITFRGSLGQAKTGHAGFVSYLDFVHGALDQFRCEILDLVIEPPKAFARMRFSGIHRGKLFGYRPTGRPLEWAGAALFTFSGEVVADLWVLGDLRGLNELLEQQARG